VNILLDNNLPPALARALDQLTAREWESAHNHKVFHLRDKFPESTTDAEWISQLGRDGDWTVVTHDRLNKGLERAGLKVFMLDSSWKDHRFWDKAVQLCRWWPHIIEQAERIRGGAAFRVRWNISGKGRFDQIVI
jgi:hypothetical protein